MQYVGSDLEHLVPLWERKLPNGVRQPVRDGQLSSDVDVFGAPVGEDVVWNVGTLAQDRFRARIVSQGAIRQLYT